MSGLDLLVIQIDGLHVGDHVLVAAIGIDGAGDKHVLALALGATENAAVVKALLADLIERGLQPDIARLFIVDGAKALSRAVRNTFGGFALIQRCQVHKGRNIIERLDPSFRGGGFQVRYIACSEFENELKIQSRTKIIKLLVSFRIRRSYRAS